MTAETSAREPQKKTGTRSVDRAIRLLVEAIHPATGPRSAAELSDATGLPRATAARLLLCLERNHLLGRDNNGRYVPGDLMSADATIYHGYVEAADLRPADVVRCGVSTNYVLAGSVERADDGTVRVYAWSDTQGLQNENGPALRFGPHQEAYVSLRNQPLRRKERYHDA